MGWAAGRKLRRARRRAHPRARDRAAHRGPRARPARPARARRPPRRGRDVAAGRRRARPRPRPLPRARDRGRRRGGAQRRRRRAAETALDRPRLPGDSPDEGTTMDGARPVRAPRGTTLTARSWQTEAPLRMLQNNLDPEVAERPDDLVVYGGTGRAARDWRSFDAIVRTLTTLADDETLLVQSGQPVGRAAHARVGAAGAHRQLQPGRRLGHLAGVPPARAPRPDDVRPDDRRLVDLHRHPGHPAGHLRDLRRGRRQAVRRHARRHAHPHRRLRRHGRRPAAGRHPQRRRLPGRRRRPGPAAASGRPPLPRRGRRRPRRRARALRRPPRRERRALSVGLRRQLRRPCCPSCCAAASTSTSSPTRPRAHDPLSYLPEGVDLDDWHDYAAAQARGVHRPGAGVDGQARRGDGRLPWTPAPRSSTTATRSATRPASAATTGPSPSPASCPPTSGRCSARARARSAGRRCPATRRTSPPPTGPCSTSSRTTTTCTGGSARPRRRWRSRACRPGSAGSATASATRPGCGSTSWSRRGRSSAPIVIGRDHLDCGSVASPYRETEAMADGSDAIADWPLLNALVNTASGATWVSIHHGGGVGIGRSIHAGQVSVADGTELAAAKLERVLTNDPGDGRDPARRRRLRARRAGGRRARRARADARGLGADVSQLRIEGTGDVSAWATTPTPCAPAPSEISCPATDPSMITGHGRNEPKGVMVPRTYPVTASAVSASGMEMRLTPSSVRSFGHEISRSPGTRTNRKSSSARRTTMLFSRARGSMLRAAAASSSEPTLPCRTTRYAMPLASRAAIARSSLMPAHPTTPHVAAIMHVRPSRCPACMITQRGWSGVLLTERWGRGGTGASTRWWAELAPIGRTRPAATGGSPGRARTPPCASGSRRGAGPAGWTSSLTAPATSGPGGATRTATARGGARQPPRLGARRRRVRRTARRGLARSPRSTRCGSKGFHARPSARRRLLRRRGGCALRHRLRRLAADHRRPRRRPGARPHRRRRRHARRGDARAGRDPGRLAATTRPCARVGAFVELHVEQGRGLVDTGRARSGVGSAIWPHGRWRVDLRRRGQPRRHDPARRPRTTRCSTLAGLVLAARDAAERHGAVATVRQGAGASPTA